MRESCFSVCIYARDAPKVAYKITWTLPITLASLEPHPIWRKRSDLPPNLSLFFNDYSAFDFWLLFWSFSFCKKLRLLCLCAHGNFVWCPLCCFGWASSQWEIFIEEVMSIDTFIAPDDILWHVEAILSAIAHFTKWGPDSAHQNTALKMWCVYRHRKWGLEHRELAMATWSGEFYFRAAAILTRLLRISSCT